MFFQPTFTYLLSTAILLHSTLADLVLKDGAFKNNIDDCRLSNADGFLAWPESSFGASNGAPFCVYHPGARLIQSLWVWSNAKMIGGIQVNFADNTYGIVNVTDTVDHPTLQKFDLNPGKNTIKDIYGGPLEGEGLLEGIAVKMSDGSILRAGKNVTFPADRGYGPWLYLAAISGSTGSNGIEQLNFHVSGQLGNSSNLNIRRQISQ